MPSGPSQKIAGHIIFVGAEPSEHKALVTILSRGGFDVTYAPNGQAALALAQKPPVDLILLDIYSSNLNGIEECRCPKSDTRTRTIPMLFLCDQQDTDAKTKGYAAGCADCLSKPYLAEEVIRRVRTHIALYRAQNSFADPEEKPESQLQSTDNQLPEPSTRLNEGSAGLSDDETDLRNRLRFEQMISDLSARFIHLPSEQLDDEIERALKTVLEFFQVDRWSGRSLNAMKKK